MIDEFVKVSMQDVKLEVALEFFEKEREQSKPVLEMNCGSYLKIKTGVLAIGIQLRQ